MKAVQIYNHGDVNTLKVSNIDMPVCPDNKLLVLQSNNMSDWHEHVNCIESLEEFKQQCYISNLLYSGELENEEFTRYMLIGRK